MHAVIDDRYLYIRCNVDGRRLMRRLEIPYYEDGIDLFNIARGKGVTHLWVMPDCHLNHKNELFFNCSPAYDCFCAHTDPDELASPLSSVRISKSGAGSIIIGLNVVNRWGWLVQSPLDLLSAVQYLEEVLGQPVQWSPHHMGYKILKKMYSDDKHQFWVRESNIDLRELPFSRAAQDIIWKRHLWSSDKGLYIHHIDKNSAYLSACQGVKVGCGSPLHVEGTPAVCDLPGIYRITVTGDNGPYDGCVLPELIPTGQKWITSDVLQFAIKEGYTFEVHEAYQFKEGHTLLRPWASALWNARISLKDVQRFPYAPGRENAQATMKTIALVGVGQFGASRYAHQFLRPNWWADVVAKTRVNMFYNLKKLSDIGVKPFLVYCDGLWIVSKESDPNKAIPFLSEKEGQLGGYKHVYTLPATHEMIELSMRLKANMLVSALHKAAGYREEK